MPQPRLERNNYTYKDYLAWPEEERWEIIDGVPQMMAPPSRIHQEISGELFRQISNYLVEKPCKVYAAPFGVRLPVGNEKTDLEINTVVEPDLAVVCDQSKLDDHFTMRRGLRSSGPRPFWRGSNKERLKIKDIEE